MMVNVLADEIESNDKDITGTSFKKEEHLEPVSMDKKIETSTETSNPESIDTKNEIKDNNLKIENKPIVNSDVKSVDEKVKDSKIIDIKDINLKRAINKQLRKKDLDADISKSELESLKRLTVIDSKISDLEGLQYCVNLTYLYLDGDKISDISPIKNLSKLTILTLTNNQISDIAPLSNLTKLIVLHLANNQISDITPLDKLTKLGILDLSFNKISNITPLVNFNHLSYLQLDNQNIKLKSKKVKQLGSIEIDDIIVDEKGNKIELSNISENGLYNKDTNKILWKDINVNSENYSFSKNVNIGKCNAEFPGNVIQPIELIVNKYQQ